MRPKSTFKSQRSAFTLIEAMVAVTIVTVACSAMLLSVSQAMQASEAGLGTSRAIMVAQELINEISACRWADPNNPTNWGPEAGEANTNSRIAFDDLDDYDGWNGPPQTRDGKLYDSLHKSLFPSVRSEPYAQYTCSVRVTYVSAAGGPLPVGQFSAYRQVAVQVARAGQAHRVSQVFLDVAPLLGRTHWFDPTNIDPVAEVKTVP